MIRLDEVGAFASPRTESGVNVTFGIYLPGIEAQAGYEVWVRIILCPEELNLPQDILLPGPGTYREMVDNTVCTTPFDIMVSNANQSINIDGWLYLHQVRLVVDTYELTEER